MTKQRKLIHEIILSASDHLCAQEIYFEARRRLPTIAVGTVYRNLKLMEENGDIRKISVPNEPDRYDKTLSPHEHIRCLSCGKLQDISDLDIKRYLSEKIGCEIESYRLDICYICSQCKKFK